MKIIHSQHDTLSFIINIVTDWKLLAHWFYTS